MIRKFLEGWKILRAAVTVLRLYPALFVPVLFAWFVYAGGIVYWRFFRVRDSFLPTIFESFLLILCFSFAIGFACLVLMNMIYELESGRTMSLARAAAKALFRDLFPSAPVLIVWGVVWTLLALIRALISSERDRSSDELSAENMAKELASYEEVSIWSVSISVMSKGARMIVFLILPAIAWEHIGPVRGTKRAFALIKARMMDFASGFVFTEFAAAVVFLPPGLFLQISSELDVRYPPWVWFLVIAYIAFAWSFSIFIEQLFCAELYLWNLKWHRAVERAISLKETPPIFAEIPRPSILDATPDLLALSDRKESAKPSRGIFG